MGNQLCEATQQSSYKAKIMEICNGFDAKQAKLQLEPITFSDQGSPRENVYRDDEIRENSIDKFTATKEDFNPMIKNQRQVSSFVTDPVREQSELNKNEKASSYSSDYLSQSPMKKTKINLDQVYLKHMNSQHEEGNLNYKPMPVPFSVIKIVLNKRLVLFIEEEKKKFLKLYEKDDQSFKLFKEGCYGHLVSENSGIFLNTDYFYEGSFILREKGNFVADKQGTYITLNGKYVGEFKEGKPHGKGNYVMFEDDNLNKSTVYIGQWVDGCLMKGTVQNHLFKYEGQLKNRKPHGHGKMSMKATNISYKGDFMDGKYHGERGFYETSQYTYAGDFVNGKKHGRGVLSQKVSALQTFNRKTRKEERFEGTWKQDRLEERIITSANPV